MVVSLIKNGMVKQAKVGFSWTTFFFNFFVPLIRGDFKWTLIMLLGLPVLGIATSGLGALIAIIILGFKYNEIYIKDLLNDGWVPLSEQDEMILRQNGILF